MLKQLFNRQTLPWILTAAFAVALVIVLFAKGGGSAAPKGNEINGVVQDSSGRRVTTWLDPMYSQGPPHVYKSNKPGRAPDCGMKLVPLYAEEETTSTSVPSTVSGYSNVSLPPARQQLIGVKLAKAELRPLATGIRTIGVVATDERRQAQVHTKFEGFIESLFVNFTGQSVRRGDPLLSIYSPDLLATQQELILAGRMHSDLGRTLAEAARRRLLLWDMSTGDINRVVRSGQAVRAVTLRSPVSGVVLTKSALPGTRVMPADTLYVIADLSSIWILADVYEADLPFVRVGQTAQVTLSSSGQSWNGRVTFVAPVVEEATRTAKVRIELPNPNGLLKPEMYTNVTLHKPVGDVITVPDGAVMQTGTRSIVFVQTGPGQFAPREVQTGAKAEGLYQIRSGVQAGETVVADANFLVDSESRLKSAISGMGGMAGMSDSSQKQKAEGRKQK
ncbi:MAG TPA: efflux RND transporter periplasmic adaptor subunit [Thermoanaerobaculia bacterium]|nr:efflux RND transporter periplasmic adaptor subunit [Thermoanaerobaculia bacterium]